MYIKFNAQFLFHLREGQDYIYVFGHEFYCLTVQPVKDCVIHSEISLCSFHSQKSSFQDSRCSSKLSLGLSAIVTFNYSFSGCHHKSASSRA